MPNIYSRSDMSHIHNRLIQYVASLITKALKAGETDYANRLKLEMEYHTQEAQRHNLTGLVCGNEFIYGQ